MTWRSGLYCPPILSVMIWTCFRASLERPVTQMTSPAKGFSANSSVESRDNVCKAAVCSLLGNRSRKDGDGDGEGVVERIAILIYSYTHTHTYNLSAFWTNDLKPLATSSFKQQIASLQGIHFIPRRRRRRRNPRREHGLMTV